MKNLPYGFVIFLIGLAMALVWVYSASREDRVGESVFDVYESSRSDEVVPLSLEFSASPATWSDAGMLMILRRRHRGLSRLAE